MTDLAALRVAYAQKLAAGLDALPTLEAAFSTVPRERFVGPPPWPIFNGSGYDANVSIDAGLLYQDVLIGLAPERRINNGQPSLHAACMAAVAPRPGESVLHVGAGTGYYSAILAELVGPGGHVIAHEIESDLAGRAEANLALWPWVRVVARSGTDGPFDAADVIYVNAGVTRPETGWLDALKPGGRLICPLTTADLQGAMLRVSRTDAATFSARFLMHVGFIPCSGARAETEGHALARALREQDPGAVQSLRRDAFPDDSAWMVGEGWWLSTRR